MKLLRNIDLWICLGLIILASFGIKALWLPDFYTSHDGPSHLSKLAQYITLLREGQFPPRWSSSLNGTLGYPVFVFSYHLPFAVGSLFYLIGASLSQALEAVLGLSYILSGIGAYLWLKTRYSRLAAALGALFFLYAPYRFSLVFVRAAIGEAMALSFLPWIMWSMEKLALSNQKKWLATTGLLIFLAIVSHSLFLPMYLPLILIYGAWIMYRDKKNWLLAYSGSITIGLLLSAFYLLPLIFERQYVVFDANYQRQGIEHLVSAWQLVRSPWGYGFSFPETINDAMSFQVGLTQILVVAIGLFMILIKRRVQRGEYILAASLFLAACFLMIDSTWSRWLWLKMPGMGIIDFPWRFLGLTTLTASWMAAHVAQSVSKRTFQYGLVAGLAILVMVANRNHIRINLPYPVDEATVFTDSGTTTFADEFRPIWRKSNKHDKVGDRVEVIEEKDKLSIDQSSSNKLRFRTNFSKEQTVYINSLYFPGWKAYRRQGTEWRELVLGEQLRIVEEAWGKHDLTAVSGTMKIVVPGGVQEYYLAFTETPLRQSGNMISLMSLGALIVWLGYKPATRKN